MWIVIIFEIYLYFHQIGALVNIALGKQVWEDQPWPDDQNWRGENAVDGRYTDRSAVGGQCTISDNLKNRATWRVDLGGVVSISHINIYYRTENKPNSTTFTSRMAGFYLYVSNTTFKGDGHLCFHELQRVNGTPSEDQRINCSVHGRYVIYYNERLFNVTYPSYYSRYAYYELCELEVHGCSNGSYYGPTCSIPCPTNCQEKRCDVNTGHCLGCLPGYQGLNCGEVCKKQTYGVACSQACGNCSNGEACHHANGTCVNGCMEGMMGSNCKIECPPGLYGKNCVYNCSKNCNVTRRCNRFIGECDGGCKAGWTGITCDQKCEDGFFGSDCTSVCGHCLHANQCHLSNGTCLNGCSAGYIGTHCKERCPSGTFGLDCDNKCHLYCIGNTSCNHVTGVCIEGCKHGWKGPLCNGDHQEPLSNGDNIIVIGIVVSFIIVLTGAVLSYIYWRRNRAKNLKGRQFKDLSYENAKEKTNEKFQENSQQYTELQEVNPYEEIHAYSN